MGKDTNGIGFSTPNNEEAFLMLITGIFLIIWLVCHIRNYRHSTEVIKDLPNVIAREKRKKQAREAKELAAKEEE